MDGYYELVTITDNDIDWESLQDLPAKAIARAKAHNAMFPTLIRSYRNDVTQVEWQINPDGRYYMDDDGFGMTDDEEITLFGAKSTVPAK